MSKKVQVLGIKLDNYTVREMMLLLEEYISTEGLNLVEVVSPDLLMTASENRELKAMIEETDLQIIGDPVILEVVEESYHQQQSKEIQKCELEEQFLRSLIRKKKTVYWIGHSESALHSFQEYIGENYPDLNIVGYFAGTIGEANVDAVMNDVNSTTADVILLNFPSPQQEQFVMENRNRFNARLCMCLGMSLKSRYPSRSRVSKLKALIDQTVFKRKVIKYLSETDERK